MLFAVHRFFRRRESLFRPCTRFRVETVDAEKGPLDMKAGQMTLMIRGILSLSLFHSLSLSLAGASSLFRLKKVHTSEVKLRL